MNNEVSKRFMYFVPADSYVTGEGFRASVVFEGEQGHRPTGDWPNPDGAGVRPYFWGDDLFFAEEKAHIENEKLGLTREDELDILRSSGFLVNEESKHA